ARILKVKVLLGLFENPYVDPKRESRDMMTDKNLDLALEVSRKSIVLLKNDNNLLPLNKKLDRLAIIGPLAKSQQDPLGWWHCQGQADEVISVFDGIKKEIDKDARIIYSRGCSVDGDTTDFNAAVRAAENADAAILVVGESYDMSGEGASRSEIGLPGRQLELVQKIHETGTPVVVVLMNGRPLALPWIAEHIPAILEIWQPGTQCGPALADILFGDVNPAGKLPVSFPRRVGQEPLFYNHKNTGRPPSENRFTAKYFDVEVTQQFPFGYGLSYTRFEYSNLQLDKTEIQPFGTVVVSADVKNTGSRSGEEIVQLYVRDLVGSVTRPVKELKGFRKISLKTGETKTVHFELGASELGYYNQYGKYIIEAGGFNVWIGPNSAEGLTGSFEIIEKLN
ncbi:glycosyl hydrolase, partial [candidate division KSB1 bacterium]|nr:glycosyl hydrolase [candidate division KSB1 bacterium]